MQRSSHATLPSSPGRSPLYRWCMHLLNLHTPTSSRPRFPANGTGPPTWTTATAHHRLLPYSLTRAQQNNIRMSKHTEYQTRESIRPGPLTQQFQNSNIFLISLPVQSARTQHNISWQAKVKKIQRNRFRFRKYTQLTLHAD